MMKQGIITINLKSDLCMGSGYSYAGIIDSDCCYDDCGIPYIPAKRLKGCFRDVAENLLYSIISKEDIDNIFGISGNEKSIGIMIGNGYLEGYSDIRKDYKNLIGKSGGVITAQDILDKYTRVQAQTKLKDGVAEENSLRFTRVVNAGYTFKSTITYDEKYENVIKKIVKATKNIGYKRNRGVGSVVCEFPDDNTNNNVNNNTNNTDANQDTCKDIPNADRYVIRYVLTNEDALMLSGDSDAKTEKKISGTRMLGVFAKNYLAQEGNSPEDEAFEDLFLNGNTIFTDVVPYYKDKKHYPAPLYINRLKKSKKLVNILAEDDDKDDENYSKKDGNLPKKLKNKFVAFDDNKVSVYDVDTDIIYHHSHRGENSKGEKGLLYMVEAIKENQKFAGEIYVLAKHKDWVLSLLKKNVIRVGKSSSVQYGGCTCECKSVEAAPVVTEGVQGEKKIVITFLSDAIFINDKDYTVYSDEVVDILAKELELEDYSEIKDATYIQAGEVTGYQSVWNLRKQPFPVVKAGSSIGFEVNKSYVPKNFVGERNLEGYGMIRIDDMDSFKHKLVEMENDKKTNDIVDWKLTDEATKVAKEIVVDSIMKDMYMETVNRKISITSSGVGRVTLMLKESLDEYRADYKNAYVDFSKRIESIKTKEVREKVERDILKILGKKNNDDKDNPYWEFKGFADSEDISEDKLKLLMFVMGVNKEKAIDELNKQWGKYLLLVMTALKYNKKMKEDGENED